MLVKTAGPIDISRVSAVISSLEEIFSEEDDMKHVICPMCGSACIRYGKTKAGSQRWYCKSCSVAFSPQIDNTTKQLNIFLKWLFSKQTQREMPGEGRSFRRKTAVFWKIWPLPPKVEEPSDILYVDGIYIGRKACILICCDEEHVLGWYLCRYEHSEAWKALLSRIAEPAIVVSDGGTGFAKALKKVWPHTRHQRCLFHVFSQIKRYTTSRPKTLAGADLYMLAKDLLHLESKKDTERWTQRFLDWIIRYKDFLGQMSRDENGNLRPTHERLIKAEHSIIRLLKEGTMFTYLDESLRVQIEKIPSTTNQIEGGINSRLRAMLRDHRGLSVERRIKAVFWWCYMHSQRPLSAAEILKVMPTDKSIAAIYNRISTRGKLEYSIPDWGNAVVWSELHRPTNYPDIWT